MLINSLSPFCFPCHCCWFKLNLFHINSQHRVENKTAGTHKQKQLTSIHCCYKTYTHGIPSPIFCPFFSASPPPPPKKNQKRKSKSNQPRAAKQRSIDSTVAASTQLYLNVSGDGHVDVLPVGRHAVQQWGVMQGAVPGCLKLEKHPETHTHFFLFSRSPKESSSASRLRDITMHCVCVPQCTVYVYINALCMCTSMHCVCVPQYTVYVYLNALCMRTPI